MEPQKWWCVDVSPFPFRGLFRFEPRVFRGVSGSQATPSCATVDVGQSGYSLLGGPSQLVSSQ